MVYQTFVRPSFSGRPMTPTFTRCCPSASTRCHLRPVCVQRITSVLESCRNFSMRPLGVEESQRNSLMIRGDPWHIRALRPPNVIRRCLGSVPSQVLCSEEVFRNVYS